MLNIGLGFYVTIEELNRSKIGIKKLTKHIRKAKLESWQWQKQCEINDQVLQESIQIIKRFEAANTRAFNVINKLQDRLKKLQVEHDAMYDSVLFKNNEIRLLKYRLGDYHKKD